MGSPSTVGIDNNLSASKAGISVGPTDNESTGGVQVIDGLVVEVFRRDNGLDDVLEELGLDLIESNVLNRYAL